MEKAIYFVRHGHIDLGGERRCIGVTDIPLSAQGSVDALMIREKLTNVAFSQIKCSNLLRAVQTAKIIAADRNLSCEIIPELREMALGKWENRSFREIAEEFPEEYKKRGENIATYRTPQGESFTDCYLRVIPFFEKVMKNLQNNILMVTHAGVNRVILCHVLNLPLTEVLKVKQDYGCINKIYPCGKGYKIDFL